MTHSRRTVRRFAGGIEEQDAGTEAVLGTVLRLGRDVSVTDAQGREHALVELVTPLCDGDLVGGSLKSGDLRMVLREDRSKRVLLLVVGVSLFGPRLIDVDVGELDVAEGDLPLGFGWGAHWYRVWVCASWRGKSSF